jgi:hypothetical protein
MIVRITTLNDTEHITLSMTTLSDIGQMTLSITTTGMPTFNDI